MLCSSNIRVNNVLRSFRSHKHIKAREQQEIHQHIEPEPLPRPYYDLPVQQDRPVQSIYHPRRPSEASSIETMQSDVSSRPSTSDTALTEASIEFNPLRLHPTNPDDLCMPRTSLRCPPKHHYQSDYGFSSTSSSSTEDTAFTLVNENYREPLRTGSIEIYGGFDFGFDIKRTPGGRTPGAKTPGSRTPGAKTPGRGTPGRWSDPGTRDDYFGVQPVSHWSDSEDDEEEEEEDDDDGDVTPGCPGLEPGDESVDSSPVRPRPQPQEDATSPFYFIKRGDWKRRGIIFTPAVPPAKEDECFDLDG